MTRTKSLSATVLSLIVTVIFIFGGLAAFSLITLMYSVDDAKAINASGSLRMRSYQLIFLANSESGTLDKKIQEFEQILYSDELGKARSWYNPQRLHQQYDQVMASWQQMKRYAVNGNSRSYVNEVRQFVDQIDGLVAMLEQQAENKIMLLLASQLMGLFTVMGMGFWLMRGISRRVLHPLQQLENAALSISRRKFNLDLPSSDFHELQTLSDTFEQTARELESLYSNLEQQVEEKTQELEQANAGLLFLYQTSLWFHRDRLGSDTLTQALDRLRKHSGAHGIQLMIDERPDLDVALGDTGQNGPISTREPLIFEQERLGTLSLFGHQPLPPQLLHNFTIIVARAVLLDRASQQRERLYLMEERGTIARELHDSMGQVLAYMKIQTSLLKRAISSGNDELMEQTLSEITSSTNQAYQQLRELLSTFRLTISEHDLQASLEQMLAQLESRTESKLTLNYELNSPSLSAQQHVHILQLSREAVLNAIKHSGADTITLRACAALDQQIELSVCDTGVGIENLKERENHFGIGIMHERARKLGGDLQFIPNTGGGLCVKVTFRPQEETTHE
ncbi:MULTISPECIES: nitrate/nitrite two-component system sensor histidine kinase NarQ [Ferrimonas]|uniref:nitrate/nitrite two-component system sensor histidine kinase NarQ n=1 Tax=Ferrimonas TaxID=44011 RepID=UPI0004093E07|nr:MULTISPECIES: nitrate/nitrite two-component system sensor histidine kinase NarQ [Ferrimonas]USD37931.1 nitrate/nitrite two-component system sensor histidine kinase NarQ [Ferrimonas sp. SCSIO 43195]